MVEELIGQPVAIELLRSGETVRLELVPVELS
jgi:hypothetical protein